MAHLRGKGIISVIYLDDILLFAKSHGECLKIINQTQELLQSLGFIINWGKSNTSPNYECKFLGFIFNSKDMLIKQKTKEKEEKLKIGVENMLKTKSCKIRKFAQFIGYLTSVC